MNINPIKFSQEHINTKKTPIFVGEKSRIDQCDKQEKCKIPQSRLVIIEQTGCSNDCQPIKESENSKIVFKGNNKGKLDFNI